MTVFDCLKSLNLSAVRNDDRMLRNKFVVFLLMPGGPGHCLLTVKCLGPGTHRKTNTWGLPGGGGGRGGDAHSWN